MLSSKRIFGLKELIYPVTQKDFLRNYWLPNEWIHIKSDLKRFNKYPFILKLVTIRDFALKYKGKVSLIHREKPSIDINGGGNITPYLEKGYTVYFRDVERYFPKIDQSLNLLASDLGMPKMTSEIFASLGKSGVGMHSDYHLNLNLLLSGEKEWTFARNSSIVNQTSIFLPKGKKQVDPTQLKYANGKLDSNMPPESKRVTQQPGDLMFVPRGWWHSTISHGDCVSVNFIFKNPTWARIFSLALESELLNYPQWRNFPYSLNSKNKLERNSALKTFSTLIDSYKKSLLNSSSDKLAEEYLNLYDG